MVETYSPTGGEDKLARLISVEMEKLGFKVEIDSIGNVVGKIGEGKPRVLLCGHMDTIPSEIPVKLKEDLLYGRGTVDAKAPLAAMIVTASQLAHEGSGGEFSVIGVVDEEGESRGVNHLLTKGYNFDYAIFGEPTNVDTVTIGYRGGLLIRVVCETKTGHSSAPWLFENSIVKSYEIWELINNIRMPQENPESRFFSVSKCLMRMNGGETGSVVPRRCEMLIEIRIPPSLTVDLMRAEILGLLKNFDEQNPSVKTRIEFLNVTEPYIADKRSLLVRAFTHAIWNVRKTPLKLINKTGTGDMNIFGSFTGKPVVTYGPGDHHLDHTPNEHIDLKEYLEGIEVLKKALLKLQELHCARAKMRARAPASSTSHV